MRDWFKRIRSAWLYLKYVPYVDAYDHEDYWTVEDERAWSGVMNSPTGQKLRNRANNFITKSAVNATRSTQDHKYACAWSNGVAATFTWLDSHCLTQPAAKEPDQESFEERFRA